MAPDRVLAVDRVAVGLVAAGVDQLEVVDVAVGLVEVAVAVEVVAVPLVVGLEVGGDLRVAATLRLLVGDPRVRGVADERPHVAAHDAAAVVAAVARLVVLHLDPVADGALDGVAARGLLLVVGLERLDVATGAEVGLREVGLASSRAARPWSCPSTAGFGIWLCSGPVEALGVDRLARRGSPGAARRRTRRGSRTPCRWSRGTSSTYCVPPPWPRESRRERASAGAESAAVPTFATVLTPRCCALRRAREHLLHGLGAQCALLVAERVRQVVRALLDGRRAAGLRGRDGAGAGAHRRHRAADEGQAQEPDEWSSHMSSNDDRGADQAPQVFRDPEEVVLGPGEPRRASSGAPALRVTIVSRSRVSAAGTAPAARTPERTDGPTTHTE